MKRGILLCVGAVELVAAAVILVLLLRGGSGEDDDGGWLREFNDPEAYPVLVPKVDPGVRDGAGQDHDLLVS